ncbi:tetrathionate reductase subunit B [Desulfuromusa kysingii]|uniref:Tetrathionate reductase subunit B n=1 Tax=Desulfuromusa kysingii TaxID=37625 RepID=A0A1H4BE55_9BACT|nr:4Fe-4S dicluster domain-containing protein [Desulfuromusa kysingii]SEA46439.1 tetrathionate reductase subunit B [Desulfuromusa kysingii]
MDPNRRHFLELFVPTKAQAGSLQSQSRSPHYAMLIDLRRCVGCQACTIACGMENRLPEGQHRTTVADYELMAFGQTRRAVLPRLCNHCEQPSCTAGCPTGATYKREDGVVVVDSSMCVGCAYCVQNCPYDARFMNEQTRTADKCTFCIQRTSNGLLPACVESCVGKARIFGDLNDPDSMISKYLRDNPVQVLKSDKGTRPQVYYISLDGALQNTLGEEATSLIQGRRSIGKRG